MAAAAALPLGGPLHGQPRGPTTKPGSTRAPFSFSCRSQLTPGPSGSEEGDGGEKKREEKGPWRGLLGLYAEAQKAGRGLKESLSPRQKGDWKDVMLMSLSFAVYVYISQKLVCAYCAWISMVNRF